MGPGRFEHPTNRYLNVLSIYEPGALAWLSYGPLLTVLLLCCFQVDLNVFQLSTAFSAACLGMDAFIVEQVFLRVARVFAEVASSKQIQLFIF